MKKILIALGLAMAITTAAQAGGKLTVTIPDTVKEIKSVSFSSGSGEDVHMMVYVFCMDDGKEMLYIGAYLSTGRILGFGRWSTPDAVEFVRSKSVIGKIEVR